MNIVLSVLLAIGVLIGLGWLGLQIPPKPFPLSPEGTRSSEVVELPPDLPVPVRRYFEAALGDRVPAIESAALWGRGRLKLKGLWFPVRFRAYYRPGQEFVRTMEIT